MHITQIKIWLCQSSNEKEKVAAFIRMLFDGMLVVKQARLIRVANKTFLAMPDRPAMAQCPHKGCGRKNNVQANYCNWCGCKLPQPLVLINKHGHSQLFHEVVFPVTEEARLSILECVMQAYHQCLRDHLIEVVYDFQDGRLQLPASNSLV